MPKNTGISWQQRFEDFDRANPHVWERYKSLALEYLGANNFIISSKDLISVIRWHTDIQVEEGIKKQSARFKINDAFSSRYARKFIDHYPQHTQRFNLRELRSF